MRNKISDYAAKLRHIQILNKFYRDIIADHDYKKVALRAARALKKYSNSPSVAIFEYDKEKQLLVQIAQSGFDRNVRSASVAFPVNDSFTGRVVKTKKPMVLKNIKTDPRVNEKARKALIKAGFKSVISLPLMYNKEIFGVANLIFLEFDGTKKVDSGTLLTIGTTIAMAITNAKYVHNIKKEIKKRTRAEEILDQNRNKYRTLVENINDVVVKFDTEGRLLYVSPNYRELFNIKNKDVIGKKFIPKIHPYDLAGSEKNLRMALKAPYRVEHEERMLTRYGWRWIQWSNRAVRDGSSKVKEIIAIGRDITEKKEAELTSLKNERSIKSIIEAIPDVLIRANANGDFLDFVAHESNALWRPKHWVINRNLKNSLTEPYYSIAKKMIKRVIKTGIAEKFYYSANNDKVLRHFESRIVKSGSNEVLAIIRDITELKEYQDEINKLALIAQETDDGIIITDKNHCIEWINKGFTRITGYSLEEVKGKTPGDLLLGEESDLTVADKFREALENNRSTRAELVNYDKYRNKFWIDLNAQPVFSKNGKVTRFIYMQNVITERKEYELKLKDNQERLSELSKHLIAGREIERADIARGVHDELGQIVAAVKINLSLLINNLSSQDEEYPKQEVLDELKAMSKMIDKSVVSIRRIIKNLHPDTLDKLGLIPAVKQLLDDFKQLTKINYRFTKNVDELNLEAHKSIAVYRTVQESLTNIIKHSKASRITVEIKNSKDNLKLMIADNGNGIRKQDLEKSQSFGLLGMRQRIEAIGGQIKIIGKEGIGTRISIQIPLATTFS